MAVKVEHDESTAALSFFVVLPPELQVTILSYLPTPDLFSVFNSSRYLHSLAKNQSLWTQLTLDWTHIKKNYKFCKDLVQSERYSKLRSAKITFRSCDRYDKIVNTEFQESAKKLVNIIDMILDIETLTSIKIDKNILIAESLLSKLSQKSSLTRVEASGYHIKSSILSAFVNLANLRIFKLCDMQHLNSEDFEHLFSSLKNLTTVEVPSARIKDSAIACLVTNNVNLNHLVIDHCNSVTSKSIRILAKACPELQHVSMKKCDKLREADAIHLLSSCPQLRHVGFTRIGDKTLRKIQEVCPKMRSVSLQYCQLVSERGLTELLTSAPKFQKLELIHDTILRVANDFDEKFRIKYPDNKVKIQIRGIFYYIDSFSADCNAARHNNLSSHIHLI